VVMRHMRPWGHLGLVFTLGLPWSAAAVVAHPTAPAAAAYLGLYFLMRCAMTAGIAVWGLKQRSYWRRMALIPIWDALAFLIWMASFARHSIRWRGNNYYIRGGTLVPVTSISSEE
jgi:ceramide glucosyltransferase